MKTVLVTGVAGLLGSHFSEYLVDKGYFVVGIDNLSGGYLSNVHKHIIENERFYKIDLTNAKELDKIFKKYKIDYVYHFAAYAAEGLSPFIRRYNYNNNLISSINVINNCIKYNVKKMIFASSMAVYGFGNPPFTENQIPNPVDPYGVAKYAVEMDLKQACEQFGLKYTIVRPHNVIGARQNIWDKYRNVIGIWIRKVINGEKISVFGTGKQKRAFSDIRYYMDPFKKLMTMGDGQIFNIGADKDYRIIDAAKILVKVAKEFGYNAEIEYLEKRHEVDVAYCNHDKAKKYLKFYDGTDLESTVREMFSWAIKQPVRKTKKMDYEIEKNMYSYWK